MNEENEVVLRDGIPLQKGVTLTREFLDANQELFTRYLNLWILYPDLFLDTVQDTYDAKKLSSIAFLAYYVARIHALQIPLSYRNTRHL